MTILRYEGGCVSGTHAIPVREVKCGTCDRPAVRLYVINDEFEIAACEEHAAYLENPATTLDGLPFKVRRKGADA